MASNLELLAYYAEQAYWIGQKDQEFCRITRPGEFFLSLPEDVKEQLRTLTSKDRQVRLDSILWMCHEVRPRYIQAVRAHYEAEWCAYLKKNPYRSLDDE